MPKGSVPTDLIDFLTIAIADDTGVSRAGTQFDVLRPWAIPRLRDQNLRRGWWIFECEQDGPGGHVELRVSCPSDPLLVIPGDTSARRMFRLQAATPYNLAVLLSAWPGCFGFRKLRLRRLTCVELASVAASAGNRLLRSPNKFRIVRGMFKRYVAGQTLGFSSAGPTAPDSPPANPPASSEYDIASPKRRVVEGPGVIACIEPSVRLHNRALEIVAREFAAAPFAQAAYCDVREGGAINPLPCWDAELAKRYRYADAALFFRAPSSDAQRDPWLALVSIGEKSGWGAVARIALPLALRETSAPPSITQPSAPQFSAEPKVSIIIPTKYRIDLLKKCLDGLTAHTGYANLEVVIVDNGCTDPALVPLLKQASQNLNLVTVIDIGDFNFPRLIASGAEIATGDILLLMNDDIEPIQSGWLHRMVESASEPGVGAVGARLLYPDRTIQHAGITLGLGGGAGHLWNGATPEQAAHNPRIVLPGRRLAVTAACLAVNRSLYEEIGGMDQQAFAVSLNDVDFCLRLEARGYRTIYRGDAVLIHHESQSRGHDDQSIAHRQRRSLEAGRFLDRWQALVDDDPFSSPAFDLVRHTGAIHPALTSKR